MNAMKKIIPAVALFCAPFVLAAAPAVDDAFKGISVKDQIELVRALNSSMDAFKAAEDVRAATAYRLNRDAVRAVSTKDRRRVLAEVFATIPDYALPKLADGLAKEVFNRKSAGFSPNDDSFQNFALSAMLSICQRCRADGALALSNQRRIAFAAIMFLKASEGDPEDFLDQLLVFIPDTIRDIARDEWIPAAMGEENRKPTYEPMMVAASNDVKVANAELPNDRRRMILHYPNPEQATAIVTDTKGMDASVTLLTPRFEDEPEFLVPATYKTPDPSPYDRQDF